LAKLNLVKLSWKPQISLGGSPPPLQGCTKETGREHRKRAVYCPILFLKQ
jgi:hypothetical protein